MVKSTAAIEDWTADMPISPEKLASRRGDLEAKIKSAVQRNAQSKGFPRDNH